MFSCLLVYGNDKPQLIWLCIAHLVVALYHCKLADVEFKAGALCSPCQERIA